MNECLSVLRGSLVELVELPSPIGGDKNELGVVHPKCFLWWLIEGSKASCAYARASSTAHENEHVHAHAYANA